MLLNADPAAGSLNQARFPPPDRLRLHVEKAEPKVGSEVSLLREENKHHTAGLR